MTIISTKEPVTPLDLGEGSVDLFEDQSPSYPPVDDFINWVQGIDWPMIGQRSRKLVSDLILFASKFSSKSHDFHMWLYGRINGID